MNTHDQLAEQFEVHRAMLRALAYRMLGSLVEADDAVQEAWLHLSRANRSGVMNLPAWLRTAAARICLDMLRARSSRREEPFGAPFAEPLVSREGALDPEQEALLAEAVGLALLVVLQQLTPAERLAFVFHDTFAVPFDEIAAIVGRSPEATRQLASRARRRVRGPCAGRRPCPAACNRRRLPERRARGRLRGFGGAARPRGSAARRRRGGGGGRRAGGARRAGGGRAGANLP